MKRLHRLFPELSRAVKLVKVCGAVAQLGERLVRNEEASGSIPLSSTNSQSIQRSFASLRISLRAQTPALRLKFDPAQLHELSNLLREQHAV